MKAQDFRVQFVAIRFCLLRLLRNLSKCNVEPGVDPGFSNRGGAKDYMYVHASQRSHITSMKSYSIQCVPIKRKPVLSVRYLHCYARFNQIICFIIKGISLLSFDTKQMMISQCMTEKKRFKLMHVKIDLRRIMVLS